MITVPEKVMAKFLAADTPEKKRSIVRAFIRSASNGGGYYSSFNGPAKRFLMGKGRNRSEIDRVIALLLAKANIPQPTKRMEEFRRINAKVTTEAFNSLIQSSRHLDFGNLNFTLPPKGLRKIIRFDDVEIKVSPDLLVESQRNGVPLEGVFRFFTAKLPEYRLSLRAAQMVAVMEHEMLVRNWQGNATPDHHLCMVLETHQQRITVAPDDVDRSREVLVRGCREFSRIWHELEDNRAA